MELLDVLFEPWLIVALVGSVAALTVIAAVVTAVATLLRDRPPVRSSARERLLERNPSLATVDRSDWSRRAVAVRLGRTATLAVGVAFLLATLRPRPTTATGGDDQTS